MKPRRISLATTALAVILAAASPALAGTSRGFENGGYFRRFDPVVAEYNQTGAPFRIVGLCQSACTLFLSIRNMCIEPQAVFGFHAGNDGKGNISLDATRHMQNAYNPKLRRFVIENGYMEDFTFHNISGRDMIEKFGYPACTAQHRLVNSDTPSDSGRGYEGVFNGPAPRTNEVPRGREGMFRFSN
jgi:hypothetical protein